MLKLAKTIRTLTVPPVMAAVFILILFLNDYLTPAASLEAVFFLSILPVLAYPICRFIPVLHRGGRNTERKMAVILSVAGYLLGLVLTLILHGTPMELLIYSTYLITGALIAVFSYVFHIKSSGHASATAGPIAVLTLWISPWFLTGLLVLAAIFWSSITLKRHTLPELLLGSACSICSAALLYFLII